MRLTPTNSPKNQELIARIWLINMAFGFCLQMVLPHTFEPVSGLTLSANLVSLFATLGFCFFVWKSKKDGTFKPDNDVVKEYSSLKKLLIVTALPFLTYLPLTLSLNVNLPYIYTHSFGEMDYRDDMVKKGTYRPRGSFSTHYELRPMSLNRFFKFTISKEEFDRLPEVAVPARLVIRKSFLGFVVESIQFERHLLTPAQTVD